MVLTASATTLAGVALPGRSLAAAPAVSSASASDLGLFGVQDPTYDGVYRQSLALIALTDAGRTPDPRAVTWLLSQQCADGGFTAYRADPTVACTAAKEDENATAEAIQALVALGKPTQTAVAAIRRFQLPDGGFYDNSAFGPPASDANSTGLALSALAAAGVDPTSVTDNGKDGDDYLRSIQLPCAATAGAGAYDFQSEATLVANDYATVQAALGELGKALPVATTPTGATPVAAPACAPATDAAGSASNAIGYLAARLTATNGAIPSGLGGGADWTSSANAVLDLVAAGEGPTSAAVSAGVSALAANVNAYARTNGSYAPGPLATLALVAEATGGDAASFAGLDLPSTLAATERTTVAPAPSPVVTPVVTPVATPVAAPTAGSTAGSTATGTTTLPMTGVGGIRPLTALGGALVLLGLGGVVARRRRPAGAASTPSA